MGSLPPARRALAPRPLAAAAPPAGHLVPCRRSPRVLPSSAAARGTLLKMQIQRESPAPVTSRASVSSLQLRRSPARPPPRPQLLLHLDSYLVPRRLCTVDGLLPALALWFPVSGPLAKLACPRVSCLLFGFFFPLCRVSSLWPAALRRSGLPSERARGTRVLPGDAGTKVVPLLPASPGPKPCKDRAPSQSSGSPRRPA